MVLTMVRSTKNTFASINRIPPEVLSLIPDYFETGEELIKLTHVCRSWREIFISRASLWTFVDCANPDKTSVYIQRSKGSPLNVSFMIRAHTHYRDPAFRLTIPHISRFKALTLCGHQCIIASLTKYLASSAPLLEKLKLQVDDVDSRTTVRDTLFDGDFSSLRELRLSGILTYLPWKNLSNLTKFSFRHVPNWLTVTQFLDFFEQAPRLREIALQDSLPHSSNAPAERVVLLPHLSLLDILAEPSPSTLLNHLHIPTGAWVTLGFQFTDRILDYLPRSLDNLNNISHITYINLDFDFGMDAYFEGPSGGFNAIGTLPDYRLASPVDDHLLLSINKLPISTTETLRIKWLETPANPGVEKSAAYQMLLLMNGLRTLVLVNCLNLPLAFALNPGCNTSNTVVCPKLEKLFLCDPDQEEEFCIDELLEMAKARAAGGAKLSTIVIICPLELISAEKVSNLRDYASHAEHRPDYGPYR